MGITFNCEHCHREIKAPDSAGGKRGKCPYCGLSCYIPTPVSEEDLIPLVPEDEEEERQRKEKIRALYLQEHDLIAQTGSKVVEPLEHHENLTTEDLHHFVINFCLEMSRNNVEGADRQVEELKKFGPLSLKAIDELASGKVHEPALDTIEAQPGKLYLSTLRGRLMK